MSQFGTDTSLIFETTYWKIYLNPEQTYLGRCIVSLKRRDCPDLRNLTSEELLDFLEVVKKLENACRQAFNATMFNWACLMNLSYQNTPPNPHVHWHFRPRYNHPVIFSELEFTDPDFGQHYNRAAKREISDEVKKQIIDKIRENMTK